MTTDPLDQLRYAVRETLACHAPEYVEAECAAALERVLDLLDKWEASGGYDRMGNYLRVETMDDLRAALTGEIP